MKAGTLNARIELIRRLDGQDAAGQPLETWVVLARLWADIRTGAGLSALRADDVQTAQGAYSVRIRYRRDAAAGMRVRVRGVTLNVRSVLRDLDSGDYCDLVCEEVGGES